MRNVIKCSALLFCLGLVTPAFADHHDKGKGGEHMMEKCDKNKDGKISEMEFIETKREHFKESDKNGDGMLDASEVEGMMKHKRKMMKKNK